MLNPKPIPSAGPLPPELAQPLGELARVWYRSEARPRVRPEVACHWDEVIARWLGDPRAPLLLRRTGERGVAQNHPSGRIMVHVDNSPAHWTLSAALMGLTPSLDELLDALSSGELPVTFAMSASEKQRNPRYAGLLAQSRIGSRLNKAAWKVCHIDEVGLGQRRNAGPPGLPELREATRRLLAPSNMFLVPNSHGGLGEIPEFIQVFRARGA